MGVLEGLLTGYADRRRAIEAENLRQAEAAATRENDVFKLLLSSPDDEVRAMAATGLMQGTQPLKRRGGLQGWFGEMQSNPSYPQLLQYMRTPKMLGTKQVEVPRLHAGFRYPTAAGLTQLPSAPPQQSPYALPDSSPTEAGAPGVTPVEPAAAPRPEAGAPVPGASGVAQVATARNGVVSPPLGGVAPDQGIQAVPQPGTPVGADPGIQAWNPRMASILEAEYGPPPYDPSLLSSLDIPQAAGAPGVPEFPITAGPFAAETLSPPPEPPFRTEYKSSESVEAPVWGLPHAFPTAEETAMAQYRGRARGEVAGTIEEYTEMFRRLGLPELEARKQAARLFAMEKQRATSGNPAGQAVLNAARRRNFRSAEEAFDIGGPQVYAEIMAEANRDLQTQAFNRTTGTRDALNNAPLSRGEQITATSMLRNDYEQVSVKWRDARTAVQEMKVAYNKAVQNDGYNAPAGEAIIVLFERALDPNSVVREAEAARPGQFSALRTRIRGAFEQLKAGGAKIPLNELAKYVTLADEMTQAMGGFIEDERDRIERQAIDWGLPGRWVVPPGPNGYLAMPGAAGATAVPSGAGALVGSPPPAPGAVAVPATGAAANNPAANNAAVAQPGAAPRTAAPGTAITLDTPVDDIDPVTGRLRGQ